MNKRLNELNSDTISNNSDEEQNNTSKFLEENNINTIENKYEFKVILIGDAAVGKTSIFQSFIQNEFKSEYKTTLNASFRAQVVTLNNNTQVFISIWDTCGEERFRSITRSYFNNSQGVLIVFDLTRKDTYDSVKKWIKDVQNNGPKIMDIFIIGNKCDLLEREVKTEEAQMYAESVNSTYLEVSAKNGTNILLMFESLSYQMVKTYEVNQIRGQEKLQMNLLLDEGNHEISKAERMIRSLKEKDDNKKTKCC